MLPLSAYAQLARQGPKLAGTGALGSAGQGASAALSADGKTALVGGNVDNANGLLTGDGAAWTRGGEVWSQPTVSVRFTARVVARKLR